MKFKKQFFYVPIIFMALCLMTGCLGSYGTIRVASGKWESTIKEIDDNWQEYDIYYAGLSYKSPSAIMFDPKQDGKRLIGIKWMPVTERSVVLTIVEWLDADPNYPPTLFAILGPKDEFFGYMYTSAIQDVVIKEIEPGTLKIDNIPLPPFDYGPGGGGRGG